MNNKEIKELMFEIIESLGYEPYDIKNIDEYFIFDRGEDSVTHFKIKKLWKHWKFGMWINEEEPKVQVFCQHEHIIDKFKPSASIIKTQYSLKDIENYKQNHNSFNNRFMFYELYNLLSTVKRHPFMCYHIDLHGNLSSCRSFFMSFLKSEFKIHSRSFEKNIKKLMAVIYAYTKIPFLKYSKKVKSVKFYNKEKRHLGWYDGYVYGLEIDLNDSFQNENELLKFVGKYFGNDRYFRFAGYDYALQIIWTYQNQRIWFEYK